MNYTKGEKLSLISDLIKIAKVDRKLTTEELNFIKAIAISMQIREEEVDKLIQKAAPSRILQPESERILQFHRLVLVMNIDQHSSLDEIIVLKNFGLKMGLPAPAIDDVLQQMGTYENKLIPPGVLINIFKKHHN